MSNASRRGFLAAAGLGTAAGVAAVTLPATAVAATPRTEDVSLPAGAEGAMAAYIHDVGRGEVTVMVQGREVVVTDKQLVARLARAFARAEQGGRS